MNAIQRPPMPAFDWPGQQDSVTRVPGRVFVDADIYALEQERIFRGPVWNFVGLEVELPNPATTRPCRSPTRRSSSAATPTAASMPG
jgi:hypothetical protein